LRIYTQIFGLWSAKFKQTPSKKEKKRRREEKKRRRVEKKRKTKEKTTPKELNKREKNNNNIHLATNSQTSQVFPESTNPLLYRAQE
jgi:hypothetical protein